MENEGTTGLDGLFQSLAENEGAAPAPEVSEAVDVPSEADAAVAEGADPVKPPEELEAPPAHHAAEQPRDEQGRFTKKDDELVVEPGAEPIIDDEGIWETVPLPLDDGEIVEAEVSPELAAHIATLQANADKLASYESEITQARETQAEAQARIEELDEIQSFIEADPVGYLSGRVREDLRKDVVLDLILTDDSIYDAVTEALQKWQYEPHERRIQAAERRAQRVEQERDLRYRQQQRRAIQQRATVLTQAMQSYVPTEMDPETATRFQEDMYRDLTMYGQRNGWDGVEPEQLPKILAFRLRQYGVDPSTLGNGAVRDASGTVIAKPANDAASQLAEARKQGERLQKQYQRRRAAGASAPAGAGTPVNRARPPKGASLQEALDWARQNIGGA